MRIGSSMLRYGLRMFGDTTREGINFGGNAARGLAYMEKE
jgi:hypothetical protein